MSAYKTNLDRMKELVATLTEADIAYYRDDNPIMSDREYDRLFDELASLEKDTKLILSGSPTQKVSGAILDSLTEVRHSTPMLSASKTKSIDDLIKFAGKGKVLLSWKLDGLTLVLRYNNGELMQAITRGQEGIIGEDVTHTVRKFKNVPLTIPYTGEFEVRGEGLVSWKQFEKINFSLEEPYYVARNFASGSTRKLDANEAAKRGLEFWAFDFVSDTEMETKVEQLEFLRHQGFDIVPYVEIENGTDSDKIKEIVEIFDPKAYAYPVDGLIMEYNDTAYGKSLGATGHHKNCLIAFKWEDETYDTKFLGVELATTRTGMVSLTAILEPVEINGSTVTHAYLHNIDIFNSYKFGVGDTVKVYLADMIIPQIAENVTQSNTYQLPMECPCCGEPLIIDSTSGGTLQLYCRNLSCTARLVQKFAHFCEKSRMNIEGLSATTLEKFIGHGWIHNFGDLYDLEKHHYEIVTTPGFGEKSYNRLQASIEKSRECTLARFIAGLGIPMVGRHAGRIIDDYFDGDWNAFEQAIKDGFDFTQLKDFGEIMHNNIHTWYADANEAKLWHPLLDKINFKKENKIMSTNVNAVFGGKAVVATGKLVNYTRDGIQNKLLEIGAIPASSVTKKTDFLIVGENAGSKLAKAQQLGIKTLTESEFEAILAKN